MLIIECEKSSVHFVKEESINNKRSMSGFFLSVQSIRNQKSSVSYAENQKIQREVISEIGFRGHGKSAYFAALFSDLDQLAQLKTVT